MDVTHEQSIRLRRRQPPKRPCIGPGDHLHAVRARNEGTDEAADLGFKRPENGERVSQRFVPGDPAGYRSILMDDAAQHLAGGVTSRRGPGADAAQDLARPLAPPAPPESMGPPPAWMPKSAFSQSATV